MAKMTNLEMVKDVLNDLDAEDITAIGDTTESSQVLAIMESTYNGLIIDHEKPEHKELFTLTETDANSPTVMVIPAAVRQIDWVQMDVRTAETASDARRYVEIDWVSPEEFIIRTRWRNDTDSTIDILDNATYTGSTEVMLRNDRAPEFYTSFDDLNLIFDSYNSAIDTFLLAAKTQCFGVLGPTWSASDGSTADLDASSFPLFLSTVKNRCFQALKQMTNPKEERWERSLLIKDQFNTHRSRKRQRHTDYGRRGASMRGSSLSNRS